MGVRLMVEVLAHRPAALPADETLILLILAEDARDETRIASPGREKLAEYAKRDPRTVRRRIKNLVDAGLIEVTERARTGRRATYRILPLVDTMLSTSAAETGGHDAVHHLPVDNSPTGGHDAVHLSEGDWWTKTGRLVDKNGSTGGHHAVPPPLITPLNNTPHELSVDDSEVEGDPIAAAKEIARRAYLARHSTEGMRT